MSGTLQLLHLSLSSSQQEQLPSYHSACVLSSVTQIICRVFRTSPNCQEATSLHLVTWPRDPSYAQRAVLAQWNH
eukprot:366379-Rhodomonas_salina.1